MHIVETQIDLDLLLSHISTDKAVMDVVCVDAEKHCLNNKISLLFFYFLSSKTLWCLPERHNEVMLVDGSLQKVKEALKNKPRW